MIGHVFPHTGAVTLAVAPSGHHNDEYFVLAKYHDQYVVGHLALHQFPVPEEWWGGHYLDDVDKAIDLFRTFAGLEGVDRRLTVAQVQQAERRFATREEGREPAAG